MKRLGNLYQNICNINNIKLAYNEVTKNTRNSIRVAKLKDYKSLYIYRIYQTLTSKSYTVEKIKRL